MCRGGRLQDPTGGVGLVKHVRVRTDGRSTMKEPLWNELSKSTSPGVKGDLQRWLVVDMGPPDRGRVTFKDLPSETKYQ